MLDGTEWTVGTTTGLQIGTAGTQKLGFWGVTPVVWPAGANQAAITDSTGGSASFTLAATTATNSSDQSGPINNNFASINRQLAAIRTALVASGVIKGGDLIQARFPHLGDCGAKLVDFRALGDNSLSLRSVRNHKVHIVVEHVDPAAHAAYRETSGLGAAPLKIVRPADFHPALRTLRRLD